MGYADPTVTVMKVSGTPDRAQDIPVKPRERPEDLGYSGHGSGYPSETQGEAGRSSVLSRPVKKESVRPVGTYDRSQDSKRAMWSPRNDTTKSVESRKASIRSLVQSPRLPEVLEMLWVGQLLERS